MTLGHIFRLIEIFFGQMSIIKCISHVLESILDGFLTVLGLTVFLIPKGPSHCALTDFLSTCRAQTAELWE